MRGGSATVSDPPRFVQNLGGHGRLVLWQEAAVVIPNRLRHVLDCIARLLIGACLIQDVGRQDIPNTVRGMRQQAFDRLV